MSCGGVLSEGWTVHFPRKGNSDAKPMYLPPEVRAPLNSICMQSQV